LSATISMILRLVGSAMAWNTSRLTIIVQVYACKYMGKDLLAQIFLCWAVRREGGARKVFILNTFARGA
jgi:hypothetical protein